MFDIELDTKVLDFISQAKTTIDENTWRFDWLIELEMFFRIGGMTALVRVLGQGCRRKGNQCYQKPKEF